MRRCFVLTCLLALMLSVTAADAAEALASPRSAPDIDWLPLWPDGAPGAKGDGERDRPCLSVHRPPAGKACGTGVLVCPGGGYHVLAIDHEGLQMAQWLSERGITAFVLRYRLKPAGYTEADALADGRRALRFLRSRADEFGIDPDRLGMLGFSAGAHLAACAGIEFDAGNSASNDPVERFSSRPDFLMLIYGGATRLGGLNDSPENARTFSADSPPAFLFSTTGDSRTESHVACFQALQAAGVDAELHVFGGYGPHGTGLAPGDAALQLWPDLGYRWLRKLGLLTGESRHAVSGFIRVNGAPLHRGWVTFEPIGSEHKPIVSRYIPHQNEGLYELSAADGLCAGEYQVIVHEVARALEDVPSMEAAVVLNRSLRVQVAPGANHFDFDLTAAE